MSKQGKHKTKVLLITGGVLTLAIGGLLTYRWHVNKKASKLHDKSIDKNTPETYAKQIKMAFENDGWWGTDVKALRKTIVAIPSRDFFDKVIEAYRVLSKNKRNLLEDMADELKTSEYNEMIHIISSKPQKEGEPSKDKHEAWAQRLKAAFDIEYGWFPGTDDDAVDAVFNEIPTQQDYKLMVEAYEKRFGNFEEELKSEVGWWDFDTYMEQIKSKPAI